MHFDSRDIASISVCAALWGALNVTVSPVFWSMTHLPFACDLIGFTCLVLAVWWSKKVGVASAVGFIATVINFVLRPTAFHFLAFTAASIFFDASTRLVGYQTCFGHPKSGSVCVVTLSIISGALAGAIIGSLFMDPVVIANVYGTVFVFAGLHALGGLLGGVLGFILIKALQVRGVTVAKMPE